MFLARDARKARVVSGAAVPSIFRWVQPNVPLPTSPPTPGIGSVDWVSGTIGNQIQRLNGAVIHDGTTRLIAREALAGRWQHVSVSVNGELWTPLADEPLTASRIQQAGQLASALKMRMQIAMGDARPRAIECDVGAGFQADICCYGFNSIEVLVPDPSEDARPDPAPSPVGDTLPDLKIESVITVAAYCTAGVPQGFRQPLIWSCPVYLDGNQTEFFVPRQRGAIEIEAVTMDQQAAADGLLVEFLSVPGADLLPFATYTAPPSYFVVGAIGVPGGQHRIPRTLIPADANAFRVTESVGDDDTIANLIQVLEV